jgi:hypothetical protein
MHYRAQAAEIRAAAALAVSTGTRLMLLEIAESYEHLASLIDAPLAAPSKSEKCVSRE